LERNTAKADKPADDAQGRASPAALGKGSLGSTEGESADVRGNQTSTRKRSPSGESPRE